MNVLIVGAGSVGQVYGYFLSQGGANVTFLVKQKYAEELRAGLKLFPLNENRKPQALVYTKFQVISDLPDVAKTKWDFIILTVPSDVLYTPWLNEFAQQVPSGTPVVSLQPGHHDRLELKKFFPENMLLAGIISLIAFSTPLDPLGPQEKGTAFWLPPLAKAPFDGDASILKPLLSVFHKGHFPCTHKTFLNQPARLAYGGAFLGVFIKVLSEREWKLDVFYQAEAPQAFLNDLKYYYARIARSFNLPMPAALDFLKPGMISWMIRIARWVFPFDLEIYLKVHFTKVGPQMRLNLQSL